MKNLKNNLKDSLINNNSLKKEINKLTENDIEKMKNESVFNTLFNMSDKICNKIARKTKIIVSIEHTEHIKD